jgi:hypothetical protein
LLQPVKEGEVLAGKYRVERILAQGGMGIVVLGFGGVGNARAGRSRHAHAASSSPGKGSSSGRRAVSITLLGVGVAGLALGTAFALDYRSKNNSAKAICPQNNNCQPGDQSRHDEFTNKASTARTRAYVGFGAGVAACVAAAIVHFSGGSAPSSAEARGPRATPLVGSTGWGAELEQTS